MIVMALGIPWTEHRNECVILLWGEPFHVSKIHLICSPQRRFCEPQFQRRSPEKKTSIRFACPDRCGIMKFRLLYIRAAPSHIQSHISEVFMQKDIVDLFGGSEASRSWDERKTCHALFKDLIQLLKTFIRNE